MQPDGNSFYGDVVRDNYDKASKDGDNILGQKFKTFHKSAY